MVKQSSVVELTLPWPPSVNTYWRRCQNRFYIAKAGISFRNNVIISSHEFKGFFAENDSIKMHIQAFPPDNRRRDIDNVLKSLLDSLQHADVYKDDSQIIDLHIVKFNQNLGKVIVTLSKILSASNDYQGISSSSTLVS